MQLCMYVYVGGTYELCSLNSNKAKVSHGNGIKVIFKHKNGTFPNNLRFSRNRSYIQVQHIQMYTLHNTIIYFHFRIKSPLQLSSHMCAYAQNIVIVTYISKMR